MGRHGKGIKSLFQSLVRGLQRFLCLRVVRKTVQVQFVSASAEQTRDRHFRRCGDELRSEIGGGRRSEAQLAGWWFYIPVTCVRIGLGAAGWTAYR